MAAYTTIDNPELYFQAKLYTGSGGTQSITLDGDEDMQPDLVWIKSRADTNPHTVVDAVRGATKVIWTNVTSGEGTYTDEVTAFDSDGFSLGASSNAYANENTITHVAWCWKESATAGFDILTYTGNATNRTISHNLSAVPQVVIVKRTDATTAWSSLHLNGVGSEYRMVLNDSAAPEDDATMWQDTDPTSSVFTLGTSSSTNVNTGTYVAYCFAEKQGYSKFGNYTGNGNADGAFVYTGFRPAFVLFKQTNTSGGHWYIYDNKRGQNELDKHLYPNVTSAEATGDNSIDILSNGFKMRSNNGDSNASGGTYIYMAFAEAPFVNSNGVPCNAR